MNEENTREGAVGAGRGLHHPEAAAAGMMLLSCFFLLAGTALLSITLIKLAVPTLFPDSAFLTYGRLRPASAALLVYGFGGTLTQAAAYYLTPRLMGAPMRRQPAALLAGAAYSGLVLIGALLVMFRGPSGPELAEFPPLVDWPAAALMLVPALLVSSMIRSRTEKGAYVSMLYVIGAVWWYPALYITGSIPGLVNIGPFLQTGLTAGGMLLLAFPAAALGAAYYTTVKESGRPLYSGRLARAGFWTLAGTALLAAPARFLGGPAPDWTESAAAAASLGLALSALVMMTVVFHTLSGGWEEARESLVLRTGLAGAAAYTLIPVLIGVSGFRAVAAVVGLTAWYEGLFIGLTAVAVPLLGLSFMYYAFPRITGRELAGSDAARRGLGLLLWGGGAAAGALAVNGLVTGLTWNWAAASGAASNTGEGFSAALGRVEVLFTLAALASVAAAAGAVLLTWTLVRTYTAGEARAVEVLTAAGISEPVGSDDAAGLEEPGDE